MPASSTSTSPAAQASLEALRQGCHAYDPNYRTSYDYVPSLAAGAVFVVLFAIPMIYHIFQACRLRGKSSTSILLALGALSMYNPCISTCYTHIIYRSTHTHTHI